MEMRRGNSAATFVILLCALAIASIECRKRVAQSFLDDGSGGGGWNSHEIEREMAEQSWVHWRRELLKRKNGFEGFEQLYNIPQEGTNDLKSTLLTKRKMQRAINALPPQAKQSLMDCLRKESVSLHVSGDETGFKHWPVKCLEIFLGWPTAPGRYSVSMHQQREPSPDQPRFLVHAHASRDPFTARTQARKPLSVEAPTPIAASIGDGESPASSPSLNSMSTLTPSPEADGPTSPSPQAEADQPSSPSPQPEKNNKPSFSSLTAKEPSSPKSSFSPLTAAKLSSPSPPTEDDYDLFPPSTLPDNVFSAYIPSPAEKAKKKREEEQEEETKQIIIAVGATAGISFLLAALLFFLFCLARRRKNKVSPGDYKRDDRPLLNLSDISSGSSPQSVKVINSSDIEIGTSSTSNPSMLKSLSLKGNHNSSSLVEAPSLEAASAAPVSSVKPPPGKPAPPPPPPPSRPPPGPPPPPTTRPASQPPAAPPLKPRAVPKPPPPLLPHRRGNSSSSENLDVDGDT